MKTPKDRFVEMSIVADVPALNTGWVLERKEGEICLRLGDSLTRLTDGTYHLKKTWLRSRKGWNPELYGAAVN